ncbi:transglycosylase SLT domain-containing protein [Streptomyces sp. DH24]|uniref:transglycosylase SLT domain-containing protein n=1 Tax=Streptomyces sp. DH24 TaxID=3040123 RepID=UPI0024415F54|nr:transglycosylase SLT domain-containing protein [Streptomyces sp. DH24]MDG9715029.1 transglycosylase SLT domain-containing protein [Streptomyces sp. DH24]
MPKISLNRGLSRALNRKHKIAVAGAATLGVSALAFSAVPSNASTTTTTEAVSAAPVKYSSERITDVKTSVTDQLAEANLKAEAIAAKQKAAAEAAAKQKAAEAEKKAAAAAAAKKAAQERKAKEAASRSAQRAPVKKTYANNLDGWIREALDIMKAKGIPGSYHGLHKNIIRESSGNPKAINLWDINAQNGIPSKGLLQVIPPTFEAYHVSGTPKDIWNPVSNITAAANYAADRYGSIDNVNSAY